MSVNRAVGIAAATDETGLRSSYERAVFHGAANTLCTPEEESAHGTLRLLTLATLRLPDLYLYGYLLEAVDEDPSVEPSPDRHLAPWGDRGRRAAARAPRAGDPRPRARLRPGRVGSSGRWSTLARSCPAISSVRSGRWSTRRDGARSRSHARSLPTPPRQCSYPASSPTDCRVCSRST